MDATAIRPGDVDELRRAILDAAADGARIELRGGGSKAAIARPDRDVRVVEMGGFSGSIAYDPAELVLTVGPGERLAEIERLLEENGQMLAFEPFDHAGLNGGEAGRATIGGVVAAGVSGSRRISAGACRDHVLGFDAVSGRGEAFTAGGKVVKNVTGYDLSKVMAGSWGRLAALTSVTLKVLPRPQASRTLVLRGLSDAAAVAAMARAMGSQAEVAAAAHLPDFAGGAATLIRLEGFANSLNVRAALLARTVPGAEPIDADAATAAWAAVRDVAPLAAETVLWRIVAPPSRGPAVFEALAHSGCRRVYDWAGGLVWVGASEGLDAAAVRAAAEAAGGHAFLVRAPAAFRARTPIQHPEPRAVAALSGRVKAAFDPSGVLDPDRFVS